MRFLMAVAMFALLAGGTWQIFTRWILHNPSTVTDEFLRYVLIWASMIGSAYCFYKDKHLALDLVKGRAKGAFNVERTLCAALDQIQCQMLILVEAVGGTDHGGPDQDIAQKLVRYSGGVMQDPAGKDLPGAACQQGEHCHRHKEAHDIIQNFIQFFHKIISLSSFPPAQLRSGRMESNGVGV